MHSSTIYNEEVTMVTKNKINKITIEKKRRAENLNVQTLECFLGLAIKKALLCTVMSASGAHECFITAMYTHLQEGIQKPFF